MTELLSGIPAWAIGLGVVFFVVVSLAMILVVLIQRPQGGGLSGAFGAASDGAGQTAFGAKTGDALTGGTIIIFLVFLLTAVMLNYAVTGSGRIALAQLEEESQQEAQAAEGPGSGAGATGGTTPTQPSPAGVPDTEPGNQTEAPGSFDFGSLGESDAQPQAQPENDTDNDGAGDDEPATGGGG